MNIQIECAGCEGVAMNIQRVCQVHNYEVKSCDKMYRTGLMQNLK